jgi:uncharacterized protein
MISIKVNGKHGYMNIEIEGHANFDKHGSDIVCAGVSAISQTAVLGLMEMAKEYPDYIKVIVRDDYKGE